ncbi:hypothetical protein Bbelb_020080 [Branchiostoma belcheri]|nr:hypothetical protein Bbelb_020080 [Branchiostoma belcheri]
MAVFGAWVLNCGLLTLAGTAAEGLWWLQRELLTPNESFFDSRKVEGSPLVKVPGYRRCRAEYRAALEGKPCLLPPRPAGRASDSRDVQVEKTFTSRARVELNVSDVFDQAVTELLLCLKGSQEANLGTTKRAMPPRPRTASANPRVRLFRQILDQIAGMTTETDFGIMYHMCRGYLSSRDLQSAQTPELLFRILKSKGLLSEKNMSLLEALLKKCKRDDLLTILYKKKEELSELTIRLPPTKLPGGLGFESGTLLDRLHVSKKGTIRAANRDHLCQYRSYLHWEGTIAQNVLSARTRIGLRFDFRFRPVTAHSYLCLSNRNRTVAFEDSEDHYIRSPSVCERFNGASYSVLGDTPFPEVGKHYFEVSVRDSMSYSVGVALRMTPRDEHLATNELSWCLRHTHVDGSYVTLHQGREHKRLWKGVFPVRRLGVLVDSDRGLLIFQDAERKAPLDTMYIRFEQGYMQDSTPAVELFHGTITVHTGYSVPKHLWNFTDTDTSEAPAWWRWYRNPSSMLSEPPYSPADIGMVTPSPEGSR